MGQRIPSQNRFTTKSSPRACIEIQISTVPFDTAIDIDSYADPLIFLCPRASLLDRMKWSPDERRAELREADEEARESSKACSLPAVKDRNFVKVRRREAEFLSRSERQHLCGIPTDPSLLCRSSREGRPTCCSHANGDTRYLRGIAVRRR